MGFVSKEASQNWNASQAPRISSINGILENEVKPLVPGLIERIRQEVNLKIEEFGRVSSAAVRLRNDEFLVISKICGTRELREFLMAELKVHEDKVAKIELNFKWRDIKFLHKSASITITVHFKPALEPITT